MWACRRRVAVAARKEKFVITEAILPLCRGGSWSLTIPGVSISGTLIV